MESESEQWQCKFCTFMNKSTWLVCGMCMTECKQAVLNGDQLDSYFYIEFLNELGLNAAPKIAQPAVATVSAAAAVTSVASKPIAQPFAAATAANTNYAGVFPVAETPDFSNFTTSLRTIPSTVATTYTSYGATYPVKTEPVRYTGHFSTVVSKNTITAPIHSSKAVKYNPHNIVTVTTNGTFTNGAGSTANHQRNPVPVTNLSQSENVAVPVNAATPRIRVINPRSNPSYFKSDLATVTHTSDTIPAVNPFDDFSLNTGPPARTRVVQPIDSPAASVPVVNLLDDFPCNTGACARARIVQPVTSNSVTNSIRVVNPFDDCPPVNSIAPSVRIVNPFDDCPSNPSAPARVNAVQPNCSAYGAFNALTYATSIVPPSANPIFTSSNTFGAMAQSSSTSTLPQSKFNSDFASQLSRPTPSTSATFNAGTSNLLVTPLNTVSPKSTVQTLLGFLNDNNPVNSCAFTSKARIEGGVTAAPNLIGAARVTPAPFATDSITGWTCTFCTFTNDNLLIRCAVCDTTKPKHQPIPQPELKTLPGISQKNANSVKSKDAYFECPLCYLLFTRAEGISLQNCGHIFCKNCLRDVINYSAEVKLQCPHKIRGVVCNSLMTAQEVALILNLEYIGIDTRPAQSNVSSTADVIDLCSDNDEDSQAKTQTTASISDIAARHPTKIGNEINYQELLELEKEVLISNVEPFDCTICMTEQEPGEGVIIRDCLHTFCRECLKQAIKCNTEAVMQCPYGDGTTRCDSMLQDREIRALVDADVFEKHLKRSITEAENKTQNSFHCKTVDCVGWCEYEDDVTVFTCPVCSQTNCINCKAIHTGLDCKQYQIKVQLNSANNPDDAKTNEMLQDMLKKGTAMHCPKCAIILSKATGCDWLCCSMCKTEICWVTRGPRWGPKGHGDTSGGCGCRTAKKKRCHPKCGNCH